MTKCIFTQKAMYQIEKKIVNDAIRLFIIREKQSRFRGFIDSENRYEDFLHELFIDTRNLKPECLVPLLNTQKSPNGILEVLKTLGVKEKSYVISLDWDIDGRTEDLSKILFDVTGKNIGTLIYSIGTPYGYYEDGENSQYILNAHANLKENI